MSNETYLRLAGSEFQNLGVATLKALSPADFIRKILDSYWVDRVEEDQPGTLVPCCSILYM